MREDPAPPRGGISVLVIGNDTLIEMLPARPIQLAHACRRAGFDLVLPLSWGDELVADAALSVLADRPATPAVLCSCPLVRRRLLHAGPELSAAMVSTVSSPVALSRHLRASMGPQLASLAFVGRCPSARAPEYDLVLHPEELRTIFTTQRISVDEQPDVFENVLPPDRRRFASLPGGCPSPEQLWHRCNERVAVDLEARDLPVDLGQMLLSSQSLLVDVAPALGCTCSGVTTSTTGRLARIAVASIEPPRAPASVIEAAAGIDLTEEFPVRVAALAATSDRETTIQTLRDDPGRIDPAPTRATRPPIAVTPPSALRISPRPRKDHSVQRDG